MRTLLLAMALATALGVALAPSAEAQLGNYIKDGHITELKLAQHFGGEDVAARGLLGRVVVIQLAGL
jgi:hypothetical protein